MPNSMIPLLFPTTRPFDLGRLGTDIIADWNADDYATKMTDAGAGAISQWTDSVAGISLTDVTVVANRPVYTTNAFNSAYPGLTFLGLTQCLANTADTILNSMGTAECEVFAAISGVNDATARRMFQFGSITAGANRGMTKTATANVFSVTDSTITINAPATGTIVSPSIVNAQFQTTVYRSRTNGIPSANSAAATLNTGGGTVRIRIGGSNANTVGSLWSGVIARIIVTKFQTEQRRLAIEGFLAWRYGLQTSLAANSPYREKRP